MSYFVARRSRDIGIRMALGATRGNVLGLVLRAAFALAALGVLFGIAGAVAAGGFLRSILFGVRPGDPATLVASAAALLATALGAAAIPAAKAARIDPAAALRSE
jgi:ABC-type antimicrobial peptide transport system permease subunit